MSISFPFRDCVTVGQEKTQIQTPTSRCYIVNRWISNADALLAECLKLPLEAHPKCIMYGKECSMPRSVGFFSDESGGYSYARQKSVAQPLTAGLRKLLEETNARLGTTFNGILVNHYKDGNETIGAHSDDEKELSNGVVACISLGASRIFRVRQKIGGGKTDILTAHGQLLVMNGAFQKEFTHELPMQKKIYGPRISLTFRYHTAA
jgi:alkylated DNA repair dioxygenase AlkB